MNRTVLAVLALSGAFAVTPAQAEEMRVYEGQPLCLDTVSLQMTVLAASLKLKKLDVPCDFVKAGSKAIVVERYPVSSSGLRVIKARVTAPGEPPVTGFTIQVEP